MSSEYPTNGKEWIEYRLLILNELKTLHNELENVRSDISGLRRDIWNMKLKVASIGGAAGMATSFFLYLVSKFM